MLTEGPGLWEEMDIKTSHCTNMQSVMQNLKLASDIHGLRGTVICSKSVKKCMAKKKKKRNAWQ